MLILTYSEVWECSTAGQEVEVVDTLLQIVVGSTLQLVGVVEPAGTVWLAGIVELVET